jgi:hypothetical protein
MERGSGQRRLQQRHHPAIFQPFAPLVEGMMPIQNREVQGFAPAPTREPGRRVGRDELIKERGDLQAPSHPQDEGQMCYGLNLLYCNGHAAPPVVASWIGPERSAVSDNSSTVLPRKKRVVQPSPLNVGFCINASTESNSS